MHHEIVALESQHQPLPPSGFAFPPPTTSTLTSYVTTSTREQLHTRIASATIIITTTVRLDAHTLSPAITPHLRYIAVSATGTDLVDLAAAQVRGIRVTNCPGANLDTVAEHAIGLYFAARRKTVLLNRLTRQVPSEWKVKGSLGRWMRGGDGGAPLSCKEEVLGIVGYGGVGKRVAELGRGMGMRVVVAGRKEAVGARSKGDSRQKQESDLEKEKDVALPLPPTNMETNPLRLPFQEVLRSSTVLVIALPLTPSTHSLISTEELELLPPTAVIINISRGRIVNERAVLAALRSSTISGYATDVLETEPAEGEGDSVLLGEDVEREGLNVTVTPHLAWFSGRTVGNLGRILKETVEGWERGEEINVVV